MSDFKKLLISCEKEYNALQLRIKYLESELQKYKDKYDNIDNTVICDDNKNDESNVMSDVGSNVESNVMSDVESNVMSNVESNVESNDESHVVSDVGSDVGSNVESNVMSDVESNDESNSKSNESIVINANSSNLQNSDYNNDKSENDKIYYNNYKNIKEFIDLCLRRTEDSSSIPIRKVKRVFTTKSRNNYNYRLINTNIDMDEFIEIVEDILETTIIDDKLHNYSWCIVINDNIHYKNEHRMKYYNNIKGLIQDHVSFAESGELSIDKLKKIYTKNKKNKLSDITYKEFYNAFEELLLIRSYNGKFFNITYKETKESDETKECKIRNELLISSILASL